MKTPIISASRRPYLWHMVPPFSDKNSPRFFDRNHWWKRHRGELEPSAALYEVVRRHPTRGWRIVEGLPDAALPSNVTPLQEKAAI